MFNSIKLPPLKLKTFMMETVSRKLTLALIQASEARAYLAPIAKLKKITLYNNRGQYESKKRLLKYISWLQISALRC